MLFYFIEWEIIKKQAIIYSDLEIMLMANKSLLMNLNSPFFFRICQDNYEKFNGCGSQLLALEKDQFDEVNQAIRNELQDERDKYGAIVIVFAAMCLEAFIYDYAVYYLSESCVKKLDKNSHIKKWDVIPKLVTGNQIPRDSKAFELLKELVKNRKNFVHSKSKRMPENRDDEFFDNIEDNKPSEEKQRAKNAHRAYQTVKEIFVELDKIDSGDIKRTLLWRFFAKRLL